MRHVRKYLRILGGQIVGVQPDMHIWWTPHLPIVHVANSKAGCSTINHSLKSAQASAYSRAGIDYARHTNAHVSDDCLRQDGLTPGACQQRYLISSVRNPFARVLSAYLDKVDGEDHRIHNELRHLRKVSFVDFLHALQSFKPQFMDRHFRPRYLNLNYPKITYDAIFYLENPATISNYVSQIVPDFKIDRFSPHARGALDKLDSYYDATALQLVREIFAADFDAFGYSRRLEDTLGPPGEMIAGDRRIPLGSNLPPLPLPGQPRQARQPGTFETTLRYRRLIEARLI